MRRIRKILKEFKTSDFQVKRAKKLLQQKDILSATNKRPGKNFPEETWNKIREFYKNDVVSRLIPGIKDSASMMDKEGKKIKVSKRLLLSNLKEIYKLFQEKFPNIIVRFLKVAELSKTVSYLVNVEHIPSVYTISQKNKDNDRKLQNKFHHKRSD